MGIIRHRETSTFGVSGETGGFLTLLEQYKMVIYKIARVYCRQEKDRKDLLQEIAYHLWKSFPHRNAGSTLPEWIYRIALNVALLFYRKDVSRKGNHIPREEYLIIPKDGSGNGADEIDLSRDFIQDLKPLEKAIMILYFEDLTAGEIASILGIPESRVPTKINRLTGLWKQKFEPLTTDPKDLKSHWQEFDKKAGHLLMLHTQNFEKLPAEKQENKLRTLVGSQLFGIGLGVLWVLFLGFLVFYTLANPFFSLSLGMIMLITVVAMIVYVRDNALLLEINLSKNILSTQQKMARVRTALVRSGRILVLQIPFYTTFFLSEELLLFGNPFLTLLLALITIGVTAFSLWLYYNLSPENVHKKWVRSLLESFTGKPVVRAMDFLKEIEAFKK